MPRAFGKVTTAATTEAPVENTTYTEPVVNAQRSFTSGSANDAAAGTGVRKVKITYYAWTASGGLSGPFSEIVTLNGTAVVATVGTNIGVIEKMEAVAVGSGKVAAGTISLNTAADGSGSTIASIGTGEISTDFAHTYVPTNGAAHVTDLLAEGGNATAANFQIRALNYTTGIETVVGAPITASSAAASQTTFLGADKSMIPGPARVRLYVTPANGTSQVSQGSIGYYKERTQPCLP